MYAAGKIPGGFFKREGRPTERAILTARMIDRPIRPLWPKGFRNEVQVIATMLSADLVTAHDILCINGASAALMISPLPFIGPVGAVRIGMVDGELIVNPTLQETRGQRALDLIVVGTAESLTMVEAGAGEIPEDRLLEALELAQQEIAKLCEAQEELRRQVGKPKWLDEEVTAEIECGHGGRMSTGSATRACARAAAVVDELAGGARPADRRWTRPRPTSSATCRCGRASTDPRAGSGSRRSRGRSASSSRTSSGADRGRAGLEGAQVGEAPAALRADRRRRRAAVPGRARRPADGDGPPAKDSITKQFVKKAAEAIYKELVRRKIAVEKRRPDGRSAEEIRPITARSASRRARTGRRSSPAARRRS